MREDGNVHRAAAKSPQSEGRCRKGTAPPRPVWIRWRDHCQQEGHTHLRENPCSVIFSGYTNLLAETDEDYIVCQFYGEDDGAWFDRLAIVKVAVIELRYLDKEGS